MPDKHPQTPPPSRWPARITSPHHANFQLVWRSLCDAVLFSSCFFEHTLTAGRVLPGGISLVVNTRCIRIFCDHLNILYIRPDLYSIEVRLELPGADAAPRSKGRPSLPSSALPRALLPSFSPSSSLPCFLLPPLPHCLRAASLQPSISSIPPSIFYLPSPSRRFEASCKASSLYVIFISILA